MNSRIFTAVMIFGAIPALDAQTIYNGNGNNAWGGAVGQGSLSISDDGSGFTFTLDRGPGTMDNALVIYIDSVAGGFSDTASFSDAADGGRSAISGWSGSQRSTLDFAAGFLPDYAISIQNNYASLFQLAAGGNNSLNWITGTSQSSANNSATYSLAFNLANLGMAAGQSFDFFSLEVSSSGYSSPEAIGGTLTGSSGWGSTQTQTGFATYTTVPEPSVFALGASSLTIWFLIRRRG